MITHIVFFRLNDPTEANQADLADKLRSMKDRVDVLQEIEVGIDFARSERAYDVSLLTRFASQDNFESYKTDPYHLEVIDYVRNCCRETAVVDYSD